MNRHDLTIALRRFRGGMVRGAGISRLALPSSRGGND